MTHFHGECPKGRTRACEATAKGFAAAGCADGTAAPSGSAAGAPLRAIPESDAPPDARRAAGSVRGGFLQSFLLDSLQTPHARAERAQARRLNRAPTNALSDHDPEGAQPSPSAQPTQRRGTAEWRESREGKEMTHATTTPRTGNAMKDTMTANGTQGTCARALLGRIVGSLLLLAGLVTTVPAQAQTTCNAPDLSGRTQIWTNTVNVGTGTSGSYTVYGYSDASPVTGSLVNSANNMFGTHLSRTYRIRGVLTLEDAMGVKKLTMYVGNDLTIADRAKLSLHICGETFSLSTAQHHDGLDSYTWSNVTLDWSSEHTRTVYLSVSGGSTCNAPDLSGRTQIWTNTVNVGTGTSGSDTVYGYSDASPVTGSLANSANNMFGSLLSRTYRIRGVLTREDAMGVKKLTMYLGNDLTSADTAKLSLHICGETFSLSTAQHHDGLDSYTWSNVTLDWSSEYTRTVYLSVSGGSTCNAPDLSGRTQIWTNTVNVGTGTSGSDTVYGYSDASPVTGSLANSANNMFGSLLSRTYRIRGVLTREDAMGAKKLTMYLGNDLTSADTAKLSLHICGETFSLSTAQHHDGLDSYTWSNVTLDWSSEYFRTIYLSVPNTAATGKPEITGLPLVGFTLTADKGTIADADGLPAESTFAYRWIRVDGANETDIFHESSSTYTMVTADAGKKIKVRVSFTDNGNSNEARTSDAYPATNTVRHERCNAPDLAGRSQIWTNTVNVGTGTSGSDTVYGYSDDSPVTGSLANSANNMFGTLLSTTYRIRGVVTREDAMGVKKLTMYLGNDLTNADRAKLSLHICDETFSLSTAQHHDGLDSYTWSNVTLDWSLKYFRTVYLSVSNTAATGMPTITGFPLVGFTLTAGKGTIADAEGVPAESTFTYQWIRVEGANETDIAGATSSTYTPVAADAGKKIKVRVGFTDNGRIDESRTSDAYPATDTIRTHLRCDAPNLAGRTLIWTGNLTVGRFLSEGIATGYGFMAPRPSNPGSAISTSRNSASARTTMRSMSPGLS